MQIVYLDTLFFLNLTVNYLILLTTAKISAARLMRLRLGLSALFGSAYAVMTVFFSLLSALPFSLLSAVCMIFIAFGGQKGLFRVALIFFAVSAGFGGALFALSLTAAGGIIDGRVQLPFSFLALLIAFIICYGIFALVFARLGRETGGRIFPVSLQHHGKTTAFKALVDSGNSLIDPLSGKGVMVAEWEAVAPLFSDDLQKMFRYSPEKEPLILLPQLTALPDGVGFYLIPYTSVGVEKNFLLSFRPEHTTIGRKQYSKLPLALSFTRLSDGGRYAALMNPTT